MDVKKEENDAMGQITEAAIVHGDPLPGVDHLYPILSTFKLVKIAPPGTLLFTLM